MKVAIVGASGKTGTWLVRESLRRGYRVTAVCRRSSVNKLDEFAGLDGLEVIPAPVVSDEAVLAQALAGCDAVVAIVITVRNLKATELVQSLAAAASVNDVKRFVFTAGEVTAILEEGEAFTLRQKLLRILGQMISWLTPYSVTDMVQASKLIRQQPGWEWTIMRAPILHEKPLAGYRFCRISEVTAADSLSREDYASCMLDSIKDTAHHRQTLMVVSA